MQTGNPVFPYYNVTLSILYYKIGSIQNWDVEYIGTEYENFIESILKYINL